MNAVRATLLLCLLAIGAAQASEDAGEVKVPDAGDLGDVDGSDIPVPPMLDHEKTDGDSDIEEGEVQHAPPSRFQITAHIQTNLHTGRSYFVPQESLSESFAHLPFLECGAIGSTTERLPLVSGVFRHVPHAVVPKREEIEGVDLESLEQGDDGAEENVDSDLDGLGVLNEDSEDKQEVDDVDAMADESIEDDHPKRPTPPKYVVALSPMEITVGGDGNNETQKFDAGDVIFIEDTWWGVWDNDSDDTNAKNEMGNAREQMKGYIMRAPHESTVDLHVLMLTVPDAVHRRWKNAQHAMARRKREAKQQQWTHPFEEDLNKVGTQSPWWKPSTTFLHKSNARQQQQLSDLPQPCSLESDPAFASPKASSTTLSQHFTQHFTGILRRTTNPHPSFIPHYHQDLLLPILAQTAAAVLGGAASLALVLQLWRVIPGPIAVGFGSACLIGLGTWGFVWLGEEILDQWELWRERRRLSLMISEGWDRGGGADEKGKRGAARVPADDVE